MKKLKGKKEGSREKQRNAAPAPAKAAVPSSMYRWLVLLSCLAVAGGATYFVLTTYVIAQIPAEIVGTWQVKGGEMDGTKMTFYRDGSFTSMVTIEGRDIPIEARVTVRDKTLQFSIVNGLSGKRETKTQTIRSLTETEMVVEEGGATSKLVRVK
jgi:uncharacterized protein (TIGR03066 family)